MPSSRFRVVGWASVATLLIGTALAVLPGLTDPGGSRGASAAPDGTTSASGALICGGSGTVDESFPSGSVAQVRYARVWVPSGATVSVQSSGENQWAFAAVHNLWRTRVHFSEDLYEIDGTRRTFWGLDNEPVGPNTPPPQPAPWQWTAPLHTWTNGGAARYLIVRIASEPYYEIAYEYSTVISVSGSPVMLGRLHAQRTSVHWSTRWVYRGAATATYSTGTRFKIWGGVAGLGQLGGWAIDAADC